MEKIHKIQKLIEKTEYWDARVFDCKSCYFGDEIQLTFEGEKNSIFVINFINCYKVSYENSFSPETHMKVKNMNKGQLGYFMQDVLLKKYLKNKEFIECLVDLSIMTMTIICKDIEVEEINMNDVEFFWENNK